MSRILIVLIKMYQFLISPMLGSNCRFVPSCSEYAKEAIQEKGTGIGLLLSAKRLGRCHPWCDGGYDPVPKK